MGRPASLTNKQKKQAQRMWEVEGLSSNVIAKHFGVVPQTMLSYRRKGGWADRGSLAVIDEVETVGSHATGNYFEPPSPEEAAAIPDGRDSEIAELRSKLAEAEARLQEISPIADWPDYTTIEEVIAVIGEENISDIALARLGLENIQRAQRGMPATDWEGTDRHARLTRQIAEELLAKKSRFVGGANVRVVKMVREVYNASLGREVKQLIEVPVEQQISNEAAEPGTAIARARAKGYKVASPYRCQVQGCGNVAVLNAEGRPIDGYCNGLMPDGSPHRGADPYLGRQRLEGASTSRQPLAV